MTEDAYIVKINLSKFFAFDIFCLKRDTYICNSVWSAFYYYYGLDLFLACRDWS